MSDTVSKRDRSSNGWFVAAGVAVGLLIWFAVDNRASVHVHFWVTTVRGPLIIVIVAAGLLGALTVSLWRRARPKKKVADGGGAN
jgi:uncharacterized integral membrane protein